MPPGDQVAFAMEGAFQGSFTCKNRLFLPENVELLALSTRSFTGFRYIQSTGTVGGESGKAVLKPLCVTLGSELEVICHLVRGFCDNTI